MNRSRCAHGTATVRCACCEFDPDAGSMVLERLDADRSLANVDDDMAALQTLSELLARLVAVRAPGGIRLLGDVAAGMLDRVPHALRLLPASSQRHLIQRCAGAVNELFPESGAQLLHWDLHYGNVLGDSMDRTRARVASSAV